MKTDAVFAQQCISKCPFFVPLGEKLVWWILICTFFFVEALLPLAYEKQM
jgi:hypothetical protein